MTLRFELLDSFNDVEKIAPEWQALYEQSGRPLFKSYEEFRIWWLCLGKDENLQLRVAISRKEDGGVAAILPLAIRRRAILRILGPAAIDVFDYTDGLAQNRDVIEALWRFLLTHSPADILVAKDIDENDASFETARRLMRLRKTHKNAYIPLEGFSSGEAWLQAQRKKFRHDIRQKIKRFESLETCRSHLLEAGAAVPEKIIDTIYSQKNAWARARGIESVFLRPAMRNFLKELADDAARKKTLHLSWLSCDEKVFACSMAFVHNREFYLYMPTYDPDFSHCSPGNLLMVGSIKWAIDNGMKTFDLMRGEDAYKNRFTDNYRLLYDFAAGGSWLGKLAVRL